MRIPYLSLLQVVNGMTDRRLMEAKLVDTLMIGDKRTNKWELTWYISPENVGKNSKHYVIEHLFTAQLTYGLDEEISSLLPDILFSYKTETHHSGISGLVDSYDELNGEVYILRDGMHTEQDHYAYSVNKGISPIMTIHRNLICHNPSSYAREITEIMDYILGSIQVKRLESILKSSESMGEFIHNHVQNDRMAAQLLGPIHRSIIDCIPLGYNHTQLMMVIALIMKSLSKG